jgi:TRAP-type uncharacterized transport system substrate-binding protein
MAEERKKGVGWLRTMFMENFGMSPGGALAASALVVVALASAIGWFFYTAPPRTLTITTGPSGSSSETNAVKYRDFLAKNGVTLKILTSQGSEENLQRLEDPSAGVDLAFVLSGSTNRNPTARTNTVVSLGSIAFQPMLIFYRGDERTLVSQFKGQKLVIGPPGSGTRALALTLLGLNGLDSNAVTLVDLDPAAAVKALAANQIDALFLMGDSASPQIIREMLHNTEVKLFDFTQADGYVRRNPDLNKLDLPEGVIDFGKNVPNHDVTLIGPSVDLLARKQLHPALSDLILEAAGETHKSAGLLRHQNQFPAKIEHDFPLSADAQRFYATGKSFTYRYLPFQLASLVNRCVVVFLPVLVVLIPGMRLIPALLRLRTRLKLFRQYRALLAVERDLIHAPGNVNRQDLSARLDRIDESLNGMKVPTSFADQFYVLRQNVLFVRNQLTKPS